MCGRNRRTAAHHVHHLGLLRHEECGLGTLHMQQSASEEHCGSDHGVASGDILQLRCTGQGGVGEGVIGRRRDEPEDTPLNLGMYTVEHPQRAELRPWIATWQRRGGYDWIVLAVREG